MPPTPILPDADLLQSLQDWLKLSDTPVSGGIGGALRDISAPRLARLVAAANQWATREIYAGLAGRGFSPAQVLAADGVAELARDLGLYRLLIGLADPAADDKYVLLLDRRAELKRLTLTSAGGVLLVPDGVNGGGISFGEVDPGDGINGPTPKVW